jgi:superfamily II DNA or RNA helicase
MSYKFKNKYVDLKVNGRLFPTWLLANFKDFELPEIFKTDNDPCYSKAKLELRKYQLLLSKFLDYNSPYHELLIYHGVGAGKTASTINIYNMLYNYTPGWNVFILLKATLKNDPWLKDLEVWLQKDEKEFRMSNVVFISYDSPVADKAFMDAIKNSDTSKKNLFIIEEAHNFIRNVYTNITSRQGKRASSIYEYIIQDKKDNDGTRILCLSGTPAINSPFELALLFNLLRPNTFPKSEAVFNQEYVSNTTYKVLNPSKKNNFQRRIIGLVSYYMGATPDYFASKKTEYIDIKMSEYQEEVYTYFENKEEEIEKKRRGKTGGTTTYKSYTRQSCNFVFPPMNQKMTGELRPRPKDFKLNEKEARKMEMGTVNINDIDKKKTEYYSANEYLETTNNFANAFDNYLLEKLNYDQNNKHTIENDIKTCKTKYSNNYEEFHNNEKTKSTLYNAMHLCSAKFLYMIFTIFKSIGPVLVYSNYVLMEGLQIFKIYLKYFGFSSLSYTNKKFDDTVGKNNFRYTEYHGIIDKNDRSLNIKTFNQEENKYGEICKIMMISPAGAEGISLSSVRQVLLTEPYWHEVRMTQMIGRAVRMCSHKFLPIEERHVDIFRFKSVRSKSEKWTTDQIIEDLARSKELLIESFLGAVKEAAFDCLLNKPHNSLVENYKCFKFEEDSLFEDQIGPAYKDDFYDDLRNDNGSNSINSKTIRIKTVKIKAVKQLSQIGDKFSDEKNYWYNPDTGIVYDYDLHYAIGKIGYDVDNFPKKLTADVYIIDKIIPIPMIENE